MESLGDRDKLLNTIALYYTVIYNKAQLDELSYMRTECFRDLRTPLEELTQSKRSVSIPKLTADHIISMFTLQLSPVGSNAREDEGI